jgi:hypothetical protein
LFTEAQLALNQYFDVEPYLSHYRDLVVKVHLNERAEKTKTRKGSASTELPGDVSEINFQRGSLGLVSSTCLVYSVFADETAFVSAPVV